MSNRELLERCAVALSETKTLLIAAGMEVLPAFNQLQTDIKAELSKPTHQEALYDFLKHGDVTHKAWLKQAINAFYSGDPRPEELPKPLQSEDDGWKAFNYQRGLTEAIVTETANELGCNPDNEEILKSIAKLKAKLAEAEKDAEIIFGKDTYILVPSKSIDYFRKHHMKSCFQAGLVSKIGERIYTHTLSIRYALEYLNSDCAISNNTKEQG